MSLNEADFRNQSETALELLNRKLGAVANDHDVEVLYQNGVLSLEFEDPAPGKIVISPNAPVRQVWISAQLKSFKLDWTGGVFVYASTGETLNQLVGRLVGQQLDIEPLSL